MSLLKKHWKKFIMASFASLWAGCGDSESSPSAPVLPAESSGSQENLSSDSQNVPASSSSQESSSSSVYEPFSSSSLYGVYMSSSSIPTQPLKIESCKKVSRQVVEHPSCTGDVCPEYGVFYNTEEACECDDGKTYSLPELAAVLKEYGYSAIDVFRICRESEAGSSDSSSEESSEK